jgi:hypothetical protein
MPDGRISAEAGADRRRVTKFAMETRDRVQSMIGAFYSVLTGPTSRTRIKLDKLASADNQADQTAI